jgi:Fic family protein
MLFDPQLPFNDLPDLPPKAEIETRSVLKACIEARANLARLDVAADRLPNPAILIGALTLFEAKSSSEIENIVTTEDNLFQQIQLEDATADPATKEALRYRQALFEGYERLATLPMSTRLAVETCSIIKGTSVSIRRLPGTTLKSSKDGAVIYTPPAGETLIFDKMANWEKFIHEPTDLDPLVQLAVQHYQFEAIHPFLDGNGRTGRILNILFLIEKKLLQRPILYLSRPILESRLDYYDCLLGVTAHGDWERWITFMLLAISSAALRTQLKIWNIATLMWHTDHYIRQSGLPKLATRELLDLLFTQPYCRINNLVDAGIAKRQTAAVYLQQLAQIGILAEVKIGREKLFLHRKFHELLSTDGSAITEYSSNALAPSALLFPPTAQTA